MNLIVPLLLLGSPGLDTPTHPLHTASCQAGCVIEAKTGKVLWSRDPDTPRFPASTTKIMTCLLLLENFKPDDIITAPADIATVKESSMNLKPGERVRAKNLAYALMLRSANDGCYAIAKQMDGTVAKFAARMNARAKEIGCKHTHFANPNGLNDKSHTISAFDLCLIAREALKRPDFQEVVKTQKKVIDRSINYQDRLMVSRNKYLWKDPTADGVKTGWTIPAGHTYVGSATRNGTQMITSLLNAPHWMDDHQKMLTWAFENYETKLVEKAGPVKFANLKIPGETKEDIYVCVRKGRDRFESVFIPKSNLSSPKKGDLLGTVDVTDSDNFVQHVPVYASEDSPRAVVQANGTVANSNPTGFAIFAVVGALGIGTLIFRGILRGQHRA